MSTNPILFARGNCVAHNADSKRIHDGPWPPKVSGKLTAHQVTHILRDNDVNNRGNGFPPPRE